MGQVLDTGGGGKGSIGTQLSQDLPATVWRGERKRHLMSPKSVCSVGAQTRLDTLPCMETYSGRIHKRLLLSGFELSNHWNGVPGAFFDNNKTSL